MNPCENYEVFVSSWLDDQLERSEQVEMLDHLVRCPSCRGFYARARSLEGMLAAIRTSQEEAQAPVELWERIADAAAQAPAASWWRRPPAWAMRAAAVLLLAIGLGVVFFQSTLRVSPVTRDTGIPVAANAGEMTEARFVELAEEVLRADPRYQFAMFQVMEQVVQDTSGWEASHEGLVPRYENENTAEAELSGRNPA